MEPVARLEHANVVNDGGAGELFQARRDLQELRAFGQKLDVPAELLGTRCPVFELCERQPARMREHIAQAARALFMQCRKLLVGRVMPGDDYRAGGNVDLEAA